MWDYDSEKWDKLKGFLLGGARGSRILLTTREKKVVPAQWVSQIGNRIRPPMKKDP